MEKERQKKEDLVQAPENETRAEENGQQVMVQPGTQTEVQTAGLPQGAPAAVAPIPVAERMPGGMPAAEPEVTTTDPAEPKLSSFAEAYGREQARMEEADRRRAEVQDRIRQQYEQGANLRRTLFENMRPQRDTAQEKQVRNMAKIQALGNLLAALGAGVVGMQSKGYVPVTGSRYPDYAIGQLEQLEQDYLRQDRDFRRFEWQNALMGDEARQRALAAELAEADREVEARRRAMDALTAGELDAATKRDLANLKAAADKDAREDAHAKALALENLRGANSARTASIRANAPRTSSGSGLAKGAYSFLESDGRTEKVLSEAEANYYYDLGVKMGFIPEEGSRQTLTTQNNRGSRFTNSESTREFTYNFSKQSKEDRTRMLKKAYDANKLLDKGYTEQEVMQYLSE